MRRLTNPLSLLMLLAGVLVGAPTLGARTQPAEFRAYWVDAFGPGIYTVAQIDKLVADAKAANMNALVVQIGRRGDCFCNDAIMSRTEQSGVAPAPFDPLRTLIEKAHAQGIEVHAWIITTAIWNSSTPPRSPNHVFNLHGPSKSGYDNWLMRRYDGALRSGTDYLLDPGHPDAADYIVKMYTSVVENYDVDGINFDRVRYPDSQLPAWPNDSAWGYNAVAVARFQAATGRTDIPLPNDEQWMQWRRDQVTNIVRRVYVEAHAIRPDIKVSADTITYGYGPQSQGGWTRSRTYREVLQDWRGWMEEGILDLNIPMNYKREHCTQDGGGCFGNQRLMYEQWNEFTADHQYGRQAVIGSALYLNTTSNSVTQVEKALQPSAAGNRTNGWVGYSYRVPDHLNNTNQRDAETSRAELRQKLVAGPFAGPALVPEMPWLTHPTRGHVAGQVTTHDGTPFDQVRVDIYDAETDAYVGTRTTDGNGWFGVVDLPPGRYKAMVDGERATGRRVEVVNVVAGQVSRLGLMPFARGYEGRRQVSPHAEGFDPGEPDEQLNGER